MEKLFEKITNVAFHSEIIAVSCMERELPTKEDKKSFYWFLRTSSDNNIVSHIRYEWLLSKLELYIK